MSVLKKDKIFKWVKEQNGFTTYKQFYFWLFDSLFDLENGNNDDTFNNTPIKDTDFLNSNYYRNYSGIISNNITFTNDFLVDIWNDLVDFYFKELKADVSEHTVAFLFFNDLSNQYWIENMVWKYDE